MAPSSNKHPSEPPSPGDSNGCKKTHQTLTKKLRTLCRRILNHHYLTRKPKNSDSKHASHHTEPNTSHPSSSSRHRRSSKKSGSKHHTSRRHSRLKHSHLPPALPRPHTRFQPAHAITIPTCTIPSYLLAPAGISAPASDYEHTQMHTCRDGAHLTIAYVTASEMERGEECPICGWVGGKMRGGGGGRGRGRREVRFDVSGGEIRGGAMGRGRREVRFDVSGGQMRRRAEEEEEDGEWEREEGEGEDGDSDERGGEEGGEEVEEETQSAGSVAWSWVSERFYVRRVPGIVKLKRKNATAGNGRSKRNRRRRRRSSRREREERHVDEHVSVSEQSSSPISQIMPECLRGSREHPWPVKRSVGGAEGRD
ncbi:hypothetical protein EJ04DRAFT_518712 [Polyplosphaeria fusca]|uniref:Uncharacterized protein n=1 Tax=Polyplosphaeria fusca TaxID=682080 RepID=A0A9P4V8J5_9PLEO|nr:hypothetical protein EJ04DRAFT_518712 [Polyplosphaeria fusca]